MMEKYKKLSLKNDEDADNLVAHLNQDWTIFKEFTGWVILYRDKQLSEGALFEKLSKILSRPEVETMTIEEFEVRWNEAGGNLNASVSPGEPEKPVFRPHREWFEMLKEPLRSQALDAMEKYPKEDSMLSSSMAEAFIAAFAWFGTGVYEKWNGVTCFFEGVQQRFAYTEFSTGYELAKQCAPDGWEQQGAGE